jgi:tetratricopeptide (TPR) repeat protein
LLLDRRRIRKWAKWVALVLAIVFVLSFLFMGVGYGGAGFNISEIFSGGCTETTQVPAAQARLNSYLATLETNPNDTAALAGAMGVYYDQQEYGNAAAYMKRLLAADPTRTDLYMQAATLYMRSEVADYASAVELLEKVKVTDPENADVYLRLGVAQRALGNTEAAISAWQEYLRLDPNGDQAGAVRDALKEMAASTTTTASGTIITVPAATTTTTAPATSTTTP